MSRIKAILKNDTFYGYRKTGTMVLTCYFVVVATTLAIAVDYISGTEGISITSANMRELFAVPFMLIMLIALAFGCMKHNFSFPMIITGLTMVFLDMQVANWYFSDLGIMSFGLALLLAFIANWILAFIAAGMQTLWEERKK